MKKKSFDKMGNISQRASYNEILPLSFWSTIDIDYETNISEPDIKSLIDLSAEKLVSNVYLLYHPSHHIPVFLHHLILQKALILNRVLSIMHLLKCYPGESFSLPTPSNLNNWSVLLKQKDELKSFTKSFKKTIETVMHTFFCVVNSSISSQLQILDLNEFSIETSALGKCLTKLANLENKPHQPYLLKTGLIVDEYGDLETIYDFKMSSSLSAFFKLRVTGLHLSNYVPYYTYIIHKFIEILQEDELQHFSTDICNSMYNKIFPRLAKFHCLQSLSLTYIAGLTSDVEFLASFTKTLNSFPNLKHLCLKGSCISNCLRTLMKQNCQINYSGGTPQNCCMLHRDKLEYLDISSCRLKWNDLLCIIELCSMKTLKYLDLSGNYFKSYELKEALKRSGSSFVVLGIEGCLSPDTDLSGFYCILESMPKLKSINMKALPIKVEHFEVISKLAKKMPELRQIFVDRPSDALFEDCENFKHLMSESKIDILWHPEHNSR